MSNVNQIAAIKTDITGIINNLDRYGICVIKNYLDDKNLGGLNAEFDLVFSSSLEDRAVYNINNHPTNEGGMVARCKPKKLTNAFQLVKTIFLSDFMKDVSNKYFRTRCLVNDDVFFTHEKASKTAILPWHFDRQQSLKFYINLVDVDESNGAFEYDLGSHREGHFRANYYILSGIKVGEIPNDIPDNELHQPVVLAGKAGTLVIFDADGFHRGGVVVKGKERRIIRGHSHPVPNRGYVAKLFDSHWWLQSPVNIAKLLASRSGRILPRGRLTRSKLTR